MGSPVQDRSWRSSKRRLRQHTITMNLRVGDVVRLKPGVRRPRYGWGECAKYQTNDVAASVSSAFGGPQSASPSSGGGMMTRQQLHSGAGQTPVPSKLKTPALGLVTRLMTSKAECIATFQAYGRHPLRLCFGEIDALYSCWAGGACVSTRWVDARMPMPANLGARVERWAPFSGAGARGRLPTSGQHSVPFI